MGITRKGAEFSSLCNGGELAALLVLSARMLLVQLSQSIQVVFCLAYQYPVKSSAPIPSDVAALGEKHLGAWYVQSLHGLSYLHGHGVLHRDIKPDAWL